MSPKTWSVINRTNNSSLAKKKWEMHDYFRGGTYQNQKLHIYNALGYTKVSADMTEAEVDKVLEYLRAKGGAKPA